MVALIVRKDSRATRVHRVAFAERKSSLDGFINIYRMFHRTWDMPFNWRWGVFPSMVIFTFTLSDRRVLSAFHFINVCFWSTECIMSQQIRGIPFLQVDRNWRWKLNWMVHRNQTIILLFTGWVYFDERRFICLGLPMYEDGFFEFSQIRCGYESYNVTWEGWMHLCDI